MVKIYHNSRCSKSRGACEILRDHKIEAEVIDYLKTPPTASEIRQILEKLNMKAAELVRKTEDVYKSNFANKEYSEGEWIKILAENPILIERPIVVHGNKAVIARPPEKLLELLRV
ncbi:MAG TPA: arsenate reductase (glutaredoxin) [Daejeonella sp.]|nr:arsenate reductase (glutaredoxin) [Daejeonella sp.]